MTAKLADLIRQHRDGLLREISTVDGLTVDTFAENPAKNIEPVNCRPVNSPRHAVQFGKERLPVRIWNGEQLAGRIVGFDTETTPIVDNAVPQLVVASASDGVDHFVLPAERLEQFLELHGDRVFVAVNAPFDHAVVVRHLADRAGGWWPIVDDGRLRCASILEQLIRLAKADEFPTQHSLAALADQYLRIQLFGKDDPRRQQFEHIAGQPLDEVDHWFVEYAAQDAIAAVRIYQKQREIAKRLQPKPAALLPDALRRFGLLTEIVQLWGAIAVAEIGRNGMRINPDRLGPARESLRQLLLQSATELDAAAPGTMRRADSSPLFGPGDFVCTDAGVPSVNENAMRQLFARIAADNAITPPTSDSGRLSLTKHFWTDHRELHPAIAAYLELRERGKLFGFFDSNRSTEIHPTYVPMVRSGRIASRGPNVQQLPRSGGAREVFEPSPGHVLFVIDYAAVELRTLAAVCRKRYGASRLAEVFEQRLDAHAFAYCEINGLTLEQFDEWKRADPKAAKAARNRVKPIVFGVPGSMQAEGLAQYAKRAYGQVLTAEEAGELRDRLIRDVFPEWQRFLAATGSTVHTLTGRVRGRIRKAGQLFNTPFQGLAADGLKLAMYRLIRRGYRLTATVHDELHVELPIGSDYDAAAEEINRICCESMAELTCGVPVECEYTLSDRWSKAAELVRDGSGRIAVWSPADEPDPYLAAERLAIQTEATAPAENVEFLAAAGSHA